MRWKEIEETQRETAPPPPVANGEDAESASRLQERTSRRAKNQWFKEVLSHPFGHFLIRAFQYHREMANEEQEWHTELFRFVWLVRAHADMKTLATTPKEAAKIVEGYLISWTLDYKQKGHTPPYGFNSGDPWMEWFGIAKPDAHAEFVDVWEKSRFTPGHDPLQQAADATRRLRLRLPPEVADRRPVALSQSEQDYEFFVGIAGHLQVLVGDQPIKLPCQNVAELMGVSKMTVSRYRRWAEQDGFLKIVRQHQFRSKGPGDATEFRFDVSRWKCLGAKAQPGAAESFRDACIQLTPPGQCG